ncbi:MAG: hypothetical protein WC438_06185 [Candidatus Pacearchaeota archaeon]
MNILLRKEAEKILIDLLSQCKKEQVDFFNRMYKSVEEIPDEKIDRAIDQCKRTIDKNAKKNEKKL